MSVEQLNSLTSAQWQSSWWQFTSSESMVPQESEVCRRLS